MKRLWAYVAATLASLANLTGRAEPMDVRVCAPSGVSAEERAGWQALRAADPRFASPYFSPDYALVLERAGAQARVAIASHAGAVRAVLAVQGPLAGVARPLGGPISDVHGIVAGPEVADLAPALLRALGADVYTPTALLADHAAALHMRGERHGYYVIDLSAGYEPWLEGRRALRAKAMRNVRSRANKLEREGRAVQFAFDDRRQEPFGTLMAWKRAQMREAGHPDLFAHAWAGEVLALIRAGEAGAIRPVLSTLQIDGVLAAVHFGMREGPILHHWYPGFDPAFKAYSPGHQLLLAMAEAGAADGIAEIHLATGAYAYKDDFADYAWPVVAGVRTCPSVTGLAWQGAAALAERARGPRALMQAFTLPHRALQRLDRIAAYRGR